jgi:hypothetical protein
MFTRQMPDTMIGSSMCILGGGEVAGGLFIGKMIDVCGRSAATVVVVLLQAGALVLA